MVDHVCEQRRGLSEVGDGELKVNFCFIPENMSSSNLAKALAVSISPISESFFTEKWPLGGSDES